MADNEVSSDTDNDLSKEEGKKKSSSGNILQIIILALLLVVLGLGGFIAWKLINLDVPLLSGQEQVSSPENTDRSPGILINLDNITVNLADPEANRFLRTKITLEVESEEDKTKIEAFKAQIQDLIITVLANKAYSDVRSSQGKFALKEELAYRINTLIGGRPVKNLYFSDFIAQ